MAFLQISVPILVSVISAYLAVHLALHRFYREKLWERRLNAYLAIFESVHKIRFVFSEWEEQELVGLDISDEAAIALAIKKAEAESELRKAIDVGEFLIDREAVDELRSFLRGIGSRIGIDPADDCGQKCGLADDLLKKLRIIARADLHLTSQFAWLRIFKSKKAGTR
ncbi:hypothetical protein [Methylobacterium brachiatum]|uniref:hypothetical protein n=1 Tax=Methylobacterium brachiatum TaxID=269660 RepID=UPI00244AFB29|nr:hypothetical protein [Methylobacterium brachiatum]MDH2310323.1 hypothetical protein [Methylobacterium brachiatum]